MGENPPDSVIPNSPSRAFTALGSCGRNPGAPSSVAVKPSSDISCNTRRVGNMAPQPGTSQIPQEIGADATRARKSLTVYHFVGCGTLAPF